METSFKWVGWGEFTSQIGCVEVVKRKRRQTQSESESVNEDGY